MKYLSSLIFIALYLILWTLPVSGQSQVEQEKISIIEFMNGSEQSAKHEFVEIIVTSESEVDVAGWRLEYKSQSGTEWRSKATLSGIVASGQRLLLATNLVDAENSIEISGGFAASGGGLRITDVEGAVRTQVEWSEQVSDGVMQAPKAGSSMKRIVSEDGGFNPAATFFESDSPSPFGHPPTQEDAEPALVCSIEESIDEAATRDYSNTIDTTVPEQPAHELGSVVNYDRVKLSELMPDPVSPLTDADDEYIEIYNPHSFNVDVDGYVLESGKGFRYRHELSGTVLPMSYMVVFSDQAKMSLANSGGAVQLKDPNGVVIDLQEYGESSPGISWSEYQDSWLWAEPSPASATIVPETNIIDSVQQASIDSEILSSQYAKENSSRVAQYAAVSDAQESNGVALADQDNQSVDWSLLAGAGTLGVLYAGYEHRLTIRNRFTQYARHAATRLKDRSKS